MFESLYQINLIAAGAARPPLELRVDTLIFSLLIFCGLLFVLMKYAWKPIMEGLALREESIEGKIAAAAKMEEEAQANLRQYEDKLAKAHDEAAAVMAEAKSDAVAAKERILAEANEEAVRTRDRALAEITAAKNEAVRELAESSADSAVQLAGSIVGRSLKKEDHSKLIQDAVKRFSGS
jgi:F-type H+-transporting ATPase subunit b